LAARSANRAEPKRLFPPILTHDQMEDRKNFDTHMFAQKNTGDEFNAVLTDDEQRAIIEYLKTL
jgi:cytochrome c1